jgi:hypothetical protein
VVEKRGRGRPRGSKKNQGGYHGGVFFCASQTVLCSSIGK